MILGETLDSAYLAPIDLDCEHEARANSFFVHDYGTGATYSDFATYMSTRQSYLVPEEISQQHPWFDDRFDGLPVDDALDLHGLNLVHFDGSAQE
jgi:hypothetical protein